MMTDFSFQFDQLFNKQPELKQLIQQVQADRAEAWLVGGVIRDLLLQRQVTDVDIVTAADPTPLAKNWAAEVSGRWFWLDPDRRQSRVLLSSGMTVDFVPLRAPSISEDQKLRDFTVNSLAISLANTLDIDSLLDPLNGVEDLRQKQLKLCSEQSFLDDPLRMLKGVRHTATLDLQMAADTLYQLRRNASLIREVAGERIRDEIGRILAADNCFNAVSLLLETGLLAMLFGPAGPGWNQTKALKKMVFLEQQMDSFKLNTDQQTEEIERSELFPQRSIFLLASLLKEYQPTMLPDLLHNRLRLSRQQQRLIQALQQEPSPEWLQQAVSLEGRRQQALVVEQLGYCPDEQLLYLAIEENSLTFERVLLLCESYLQHQRLGRVPDLLCGKEIAASLPEGPEHEIGLWQKRLKTAEISGEIASQEAAVAWLENQNSI